MRGKSKNKVLLLILVAAIIPVLAIAVILPRVNTVLALTGGENAKTEMYDVFFADYSDDPELDTTRFTIKLLLEVANGDKIADR